MDNIFTNALFPPNNEALTPSSAVANIYNQKVYLLLMTIKDPLVGGYRNAMVSWDQNDWFLSSQTLDLTYIGTQEVNSDLTAWGTNGITLFPLFGTPSPALTKTLSTKLYGANTAIIVKEALGFYLQAQDLSGTNASVTLTTATTDSEIGSFALPNSISFVSAPPAYNTYATTSGDVFGTNLGLTISSQSPDFSIQYLGLGYIDAGSLFGNTPIASDTIE